MITTRNRIVEELEMISEVCPLQYEGRTMDNQFVYLRFRNGKFTAEVGSNLIYSEHDLDNISLEEMLEKSRLVLVK